MPSDEELMARVADGEETAFEQLLRRYQRPLAAFIWRNTGGADVDDIYQETWIRVVRNASRFDSAKRFPTWLFQIAVNLCRDRFRRAAVAGGSGRDATGSGAGSGTGPADGIPCQAGASVASEATRVEAAVDAERLLAQLGPEHREVLLLRYYQDLSEDEVSRILDIPRGTVKSRLHNAIKTLSALVKERPS